MVANVKRILEILAVKIGTPETPFLFVRKNHGGRFPETPFGRYSIFPVRSDLSGFYPYREKIESDDPTKAEYRCRKLEEATVSLSFNGGFEVIRTATGIIDPLEKAEQLAQAAMDVIVLSGIEEFRREGFVIRPITGIEDRTIQIEGMQTMYVCGFDISVKAYRTATLIVDLMDVEATEESSAIEMV